MIFQIWSVWNAVIREGDVEFCQMDAVLLFSYFPLVAGTRLLFFLRFNQIGFMRNIMLDTRLFVLPTC